MSQADLFASTELNYIDSRSLDWLTSDHVQVTTKQMEHNGKAPRKQLFLIMNSIQAQYWLKPGKKWKMLKEWY